MEQLQWLQFSRSSPKASKYLESYYDSMEYDKDLERQKDAEKKHRAQSCYQFCIEDVDPEVLYELERRKRHEAAETERRAQSRYQYCIEDMDPEVLHELERRKRRRLELESKEASA